MNEAQKRKQAQIIKEGTAEDAYNLAKHFPAADIDAMQKVVLERGNGRDIFRFASTIPGADIAALQKVLLDRGDANIARLFARHIEGADIAECQKVVMAKWRPGELYSFARDIPSADIKCLYLRAEAKEFDWMPPGDIAHFNEIYRSQFYPSHGKAATRAVAHKEAPTLASVIDDLDDIIGLAQSGRVVHVERLAKEAMAKLKELAASNDVGLTNQEEESFGPR